MSAAVEGPTFAVACSPPPKQKPVISTEATGSLTVRRAVEKPALSEAEWDPRICLYFAAALPFVIQRKIVRATQQPVVGQFDVNDSTCRKCDFQGIRPTWLGEHQSKSSNPAISPDRSTLRVVSRNLGHH